MVSVNFPMVLIPKPVHLRRAPKRWYFQIRRAPERRPWDAHASFTNEKMVENIGVNMVLVVLSTSYQ